MANQEYNVALSIKKQAELCKKNNAPHFAPSSGRCWSCGKNIYSPIGWKRDGWRRVEVPLDSPELNFTTGITVEKASAELITGCPHCNRSYCD